MHKNKVISQSLILIAFDKMHEKKVSDWLTYFLCPFLCKVHASVCSLNNPISSTHMKKCFGRIWFFLAMFVTIFWPFGFTCFWSLFNLFLPNFCLILDQFLEFFKCLNHEFSKLQSRVSSKVSRKICLQISKLHPCRV